jgi:hypothetical protein
MKRDGRNGAALLLVILLIALLAVGVVEFQREAWVHGRTAESLRDDLQAHAVLRSGSQLTGIVLNIYAGQPFSGMKVYADTTPQAQMLWDLFFGDAWVTLPVPAGAEDPYIPLGARIEDLGGKFPVGALYEPATAVEYRQALEEYLTAVKEYRAGNAFLDELDPGDFADKIAEYVKEAPDPKDPLRDLSQLLEIEGMTPQMLDALVPFLDRRVPWTFSANGLTVPMIMLMTGKTVEEAQTIRADLQDSPLDDAAAIASSPLSARNATRFPPASLVPKSEGFALYLEAEVRGVLRNAYAVYRKAGPAGGAQAGGGPAKYRLETWVEERVPGWPSRDEVVPKPSPGPSPAPGTGSP